MKYGLYVQKRLRKIGAEFYATCLDGNHRACDL